MWDAVEGANRYEVKLYKDHRQLAAMTVKGNTCDFSSYINSEGSYTFNVRVLGSYTTSSSVWSTDSDAKVLTREDAWTRANGTWQKSASQWRFKYKDGTYAANCWRVINDKWYYFNYNGYMESNCHVKSNGMEMNYWLGSDGAWMPEWDMAAPDRGAYRIV